MTEKTVLSVTHWILILTIIFGVPYFFDGQNKYYAYALMLVILAIVSIRLTVVRRRDRNQER